MPAPEQFKVGSTPRAKRAGLQFVVPAGKWIVRKAGSGVGNVWPTRGSLGRRGGDVNVPHMLPAAVVVLSFVETVYLKLCLLIRLNMSKISASLCLSCRVKVFEARKSILKKLGCRNELRARCTPLMVGLSVNCLSLLLSIPVKALKGMPVRHVVIVETWNPKGRS